jgi:hypothetical protein
MDENSKVVDLYTAKRRPSLTDEVDVKASSVTSSTKLQQLSTSIKNINHSLMGKNKTKENLESVAEPYSKTEIDSKFDVVNQKIEHNQEKMELIVSKAMDNISYQITSLDKNLDTSVKLLEKQIDSKLSKIESKALYYVVGSLLVPILLVAAPFTLKILLTMLNTLTGH